MAAKILLCAVLAMVAFQDVCSLPPGQSKLNDRVQDALDKANKAIYDVTVNVEANGIEAIGTISVLRDAVKNQAQKLITRANSRIEGMNALMDYKIKDLLDIAADQGVDTLYCVVEKEVIIGGYMKETHFLITQCTDTEFPEVTTLISDVTVLVRKGYELGKAMERNIEDCMESSEPLMVVLCIEEYTNILRLQAANLKEQIREAAAKGEKWAARTSTNISVCVAIRLLEMEQPAAGILMDLTICVYDKIVQKPQKMNLPHVTDVVPTK